MEISFTKKQYKTLLQLLYLGEWVANSSKIKEDKLYKESDALEQYFFYFTGSGNVHYKGQPVIQSSITGSGKIYNAN